MRSADTGGATALLKAAKGSRYILPRAYYTLIVEHLNRSLGFSKEQAIV